MEPGYVIISDLSNHTDDVFYNTPPQRPLDSEYAALDEAMSAARPIIFIEPHALGNEVTRWIRLGNALHKTAVLSAIGSLAVGQLDAMGRINIGLSLRISDDSLMTVSCIMSTALGFISIASVGVYTLSWGRDACCRYQTQSDIGQLGIRLPVVGLQCPSPVALVRRDDTRRRVLQNVLATAAGLYLMQRFVRSMISV